MSSRLTLYGSELRALVKLALPLAVVHAGQALMGFVDTAVLGRSGTGALATVGFCEAIVFAVGSFGVGLMLGVDPLISQALGARDGRRAWVMLWQGGYLAAGAGALLAGCVAGLPHLLPYLGWHAADLAQVQGYLGWRALSLPFLLLFVASRNYLQATSRVSPLMAATVGANVLNLGADVLFVFGGAVLPAAFGPLRSLPALGAKGAALSTLLCCMLQCGVALAAVRRPPTLEGSPMVGPKRDALRQAIRVGLPIGLHYMAEVGVFALAGVMARTLGPESIGAHQIALVFANLTFTLARGFGSAGSVRVGLAVGAGDTPLARRRGLLAFVGGGTAMGLCGLAFALFPVSFAKLMGAPREVLPLAIQVLLVAAVFQLSDGLQGVGAGVLRGAGETRFTFRANMVGHYAVGLPVALLLGFKLNLGIVGIWWGLCAGLTSVALALFLRFERLSGGDLRAVKT